MPGRAARHGAYGCSPAQGGASNLLGLWRGGRLVLAGAAAGLDGLVAADLRSVAGGQVVQVGVLSGEAGLGIGGLGAGRADPDAAFLLGAAATRRTGSRPRAWLVMAPRSPRVVIAPPRGLQHRGRWPSGGAVRGRPHLVGRWAAHGDASSPAPASTAAASPRRADPPPCTPRRRRADRPSSAPTAAGAAPACGRLRRYRAEIRRVCRSCRKSSREYVRGADDDIGPVGIGHFRLCLFDEWRA